MEYEIIINKKNIKTLRVSATAEALLVSAPENMNREIIMNFIEKNKIQLEEMISLKRNMKYQNDIGNKIIYLFGKRLDEMLVENIDTEEKLELLYKKELLKILPMIFEKYNKLTGLMQREFKIRKMNARWGTCYPDRKLINLNLYLAKRPIDEIESVVLHELVHLKIANHSKKFYTEIKKYMPDYDEIHKKLNS
ncbi:MULTISPECIES: M48 family metallopeptidase [Peptoniphilus]|uniref:M48 family metallopeptidase n=1 Tax=Peptoniphilus TaxID=162289 RepID=UPI0001DA9DE5|nr:MULTISPECIES: M48 family metallopeptidase [Peptoniphilus]EFI41448.1 hypothetical protein HMPREF0629_00067 [Peptoniphilus sp. oral taxon 386 str. F0131]